MKVIIKPHPNPMLKETDTNHMSDFITANYYSMSISGLEQILSTHWHDEWEFFCVAEGCVLFQIDDCKFPLEAGEAAFIRGGQIHAGYAIEGSSCTFFALVFHPSVLAAPEYDSAYMHYIMPILEGDVDVPAKLTPTVPWQKDVIENVKASVELFKAKPVAYELIVKANLLSLFAVIYGQCAIAGNRRESPESLSYRAKRIQNIIDYINTNYNSKISVAEISKIANMSTGYLCRFFKKMTGLTIMDYINRYRVAQAALLIESTDKKFIEVAGLSGFNNLSYFVSQFKRCMGVTPSAFKKMQNANRT